MTDLARRTWPEVRALLDAGCAALLPVGSTEAHGPHLPLDTDVTIALGMARRAAERLQDAGRACVVLPPVACSVTDFAAPFAGTLSLPAGTARAYLRDVLCAAAAAGFRPLGVANAHLEPAHVETLRQAVEEAARRSGVAIAFPDITRRDLARQLGEEFCSGACHAGRYETSLVQADDPAGVQEDLRRRLPEVPRSLVDAIREGQRDFLEAGGPQAYFGSPAAASAEEGQATFELLADMLAKAIEEAAGR